jgi:hypothetical protein
MVTRRVFTPVIAQIMLLCDLPMDSIMVRCIDQDGQESLSEVTTIGIGEVNDFFTVEPDGKFEAKLILLHLCMFKAFLLIIGKNDANLYSK